MKKLAACVVPTMKGRPLEKLLLSMEKTVENPLRYVLVSTDRNFVEEFRSMKIDHKNYDHLYLPKCGVGAPRKLGVDYALSKYDPDVIINTDDDVIVKVGSVDRLINLSRNNKRFAYIASIGNLGRWIPNLDDTFVLNTRQNGGLFALRADFIKKYGHFDDRAKVYEDLDLTMKVWENGYYVVAIKALYAHKRRFCEMQDDGAKPGGKEWLESMDMIAKKYPCLKLTKTRCIWKDRPKHFYHKFIINTDTNKFIRIN